MFVDNKNHDQEKISKDAENKNEKVNPKKCNHTQTENIDLKTNIEQDDACNKTSSQYYVKFLETQVNMLEKELTALRKEHDYSKLKFQADLDNFTKRMTKEKNNTIKYASTELIDKILIPFEQFDKVLENTISPNEAVKNFLIGFKMIHQQIKNVFEEEGLKEIKALGEVFDPTLHYAMEKISDKNSPNNTNVHVFQKGYVYKERVLKPAMVKVNEWSAKDGKDK